MVRDTLASAPEWLVPRGLPTEALVAHAMVSKFGDNLPFYRQADIYHRQGIDLDRSMLVANWSGRAAQLLDPIIDHMITSLKRSGHLQMDETTVPVLAPGTGKVRRDYLWAILRDQRGWSGNDPPVVVFHHSRSRSGKVARHLLKGFAGGTLMVDGYTGYDSLADPKQTARPWEIAYCWTRRQWSLRPVAQPQATDAGSSSSGRTRPRRSARRSSRASLSFTRSRRTSGARPPTLERQSGRRCRSPSSMRCGPGWRLDCRSCRRPATWPGISATG